MKKFTMEEETRWFRLIKEVRGKRVIFDTGLAEIFDLDLDIIRDVANNNREQLKKDLINLPLDDANDALYAFTDRAILILLVLINDLLYDFDLPSFVGFITYAFNVLFDYKKFFEEDHNLYFLDSEPSDFYFAYNCVFSLAKKTVTIIGPELDERIFREIKEFDKDLKFEIFGYNDVLLEVYRDYALNNSINVKIKKMKHTTRDIYILIDWDEGNKKLISSVRSSDFNRYLYYFIDYSDTCAFEALFKNITGK